MYQLVARKDTGLGVTTALSVTLHVAAFAFLVWWQQLMPDLGPVQTTYYVDVVNLPVANPRAGSPTETGNEKMPAPPAPTPPTMAVPKAPTKKAPGKKPTTTPTTESAAFQERMAKLEGKVDAQRQTATFEELRKKVAARGKVGMPKGTGTEAGSDYTAYLHSRLKDAFRDTISYQTKNPFVMVRITIDGDGRIIRTRIEKSTGDKAFELSVARAITLAEQAIVPPPSRTVYEGAFVFKPQGVTQR
ncbi:Cell division and transport-associated protein TolA [Trichlorobacter thiogenes]|uniref:Cell division and transport-associated protein TolA n=1 Tax=Trichlorobacter thiogenes TaxID=115783 RepID=A0A1T4JZG2_9BACT|nr:energy transducer TonB [Trichlorobacter thiogenes]SJZ35514.1 Cell division and transport-associated protein TolA [Trichlorobacter thiogenes]